MISKTGGPVLLIWSIITSQAEVMAKWIYAIILVLLQTMVCNSQSLVRSTIGAFGGSTNGDVFFVQHSVGQPSAIQFKEFADGSGIRQGFNQPYYIVKNAQVTLEVLLYPNPNNGVFSFQLLNMGQQEYLFEISDQLGRLCYSGSGLGDEIIKVELNPNQSGLCFLMIHHEQSVSTFKILITE